MTLPLNDPDRILALAYAPGAQRDALSALWALDETLGRIVATTTQDIVGQMRLSWWHQNLCALDSGAIAAEPVLVALAGVVRNHDVTGAALAGLVEGWEVLLEDLLTDGDLADYAKARGAWLFALSSEILGSTRSDAVGQGWALADFARHCSDETLARRALALSPVTAIPRRLPKPLRMLAWLARYDVAHGAPRVRPRWTMLRAALA